MQSDRTNEKMRIAKDLLLSSPPGQFQKTVSNLKSIFNSNDPESAQLMDDGFLKKVQALYETNTGRNALMVHNNDCDNFGQSLEESFQNYIKKYCSSKDVASQCIVNVMNSTSNSYEVVLYAERIKLPQFHAGSWFAKYVIETNNDDNYVDIKGTIEIQTHVFENGNVLLKSKTELPIRRIHTSSSSSIIEDVMSQVQHWDEEHVVSVMHSVYNNMSNDILKQMRRVMPVTRTKFDWNIEETRLVKTMEMNVQNNRA